MAHKVIPRKLRHFCCVGMRAASNDCKAHHRSMILIIHYQCMIFSIIVPILKPRFYSVAVAVIFKCCSRNCARIQRYGSDVIFSKHKPYRSLCAAFQWPYLWIPPVHCPGWSKSGKPFRDSPRQFLRHM